MFNWLMGSARGLCGGNFENGWVSFALGRPFGHSMTQLGNEKYHYERTK